MASALFLLAAVIMTGSPPFGLFFSEMTILKAGFVGPHLAVVAVFLACLVLLFCGFFYQVGRVVLGPDTNAGATAPSCPSGSTWHRHDARGRGPCGGLGVLPAPGAPGPHPRGGARGGGRMSATIQAVSEALADTPELGPRAEAR